MKNAGGLMERANAAVRRVRDIYHLLPLGATRRARIKALVNVFWLPLSKLFGSGDPPWSQLVPEWRADWSSLFPPVETAGRRILVIDWKAPTPDRDSGSFRMRMILDLMSERGWIIDFIGDRPAEALSYETSLEEVGIRVIVGQGEALRYLTRHGAAYQTVWISRPETAERYLPMVRSLAVQARVIYDTVDLHWIRLRRGIPFSDQPETVREDAERYRAIELCNARCSDLTIAISEDEKQAILNEVPGLAVAVLPNIHPVFADVEAVGARSDLFFIGSFHHPPNVDAVFYFVREVFPLILERIPDVRFHIAGSDMPYAVRALKSRNVDPLGYVRDVTPWFQRARVFVAPLRHGAGMKGKVGQSLAFGLPVVTTSVGAEGMGLVHEVDALIAEDAGDFAEAVIRLYSDDKLWQQISRGGQALMNRHFSKEAVGRALTSLLCASG
ncbi:glycosyltransferase [Thiocapsa sp. UBA6158]|uniref:glycosyltransferase n=1 Tax=Thiocapsa sp. UBA6158 TaxID=1947692 RepID=UPI0025FB2FA0|nr:glycosyltransferase family 4 protein [Thiocapsa sp. UBA6158]